MGRSPEPSLVAHDGCIVARAGAAGAAIDPSQERPIRGTPGTCLRCGRELLDLPSLAEQANGLRAAVSAALTLDLQGSTRSPAHAPDGCPQVALLKALMKTEDLAVAHARAVACLAGTCGNTGSA